MGKIKSCLSQQMILRFQICIHYPASPPSFFFPTGRRAKPTQEGRGHRYVRCDAGGQVGGGSETRWGGGGDEWRARLITCSTVSPGCMSVKTSTLYDTSPKVGVLSLASTTRMLTVTGLLCWTPSDADICERAVSFSPSNYIQKKRQQTYLRRKHEMFTGNRV